MSSKNLTEKFKKETLPLIYLVVGLFALRWTLVEPYVVPTGSMEPTLKVGDRLYALKCAYDVRFPFTDMVMFRTGQVKRGDVILFKAPRDPSVTYVKRAVGLPGDRIKVQAGVLFINGEPVTKVPFPDKQIMYDISGHDHKTLSLENLHGVKHYQILDDRIRNDDPFDPHWRNFPEVVVPPDHFFAMGDNRDNSYDSRGWGFAPMANLKGKAMFIWFSAPVDAPDDSPLVSQLMKSFLAILTFWDWNIRFERIGTLIQ